MAAVCTSHVRASWILSAGESIAGREYFFVSDHGSLFLCMQQCSSLSDGTLMGAFFALTFVRPYDLTSGMY